MKNHTIRHFHPLLISLFFLWWIGGLSLSQADSLFGYENSEIHSLKIWVQTHSLIMDGTQVVQVNPATGNPIPGDTTTWNEVYIDIPGNRWVERVFLQNDKPDSSAQPTTESIQSQQTTTSINHLRKTVFLSKVSLQSIDSHSIIFAGRIHQGNRLASLIEEASTAGNLFPTEKGWTLEIGTPYFTPPTHPEPIFLELDSDYLPIRLNDNGRAFSFDWGKTKPEGFPYVRHTIMETHPIQKTLVQFEQWVREIEVNPQISDQIFQVAYPQEYEIHDFSKRLRSPFQ